MAGTRAGGLAAAETNKIKHGIDFYQKIGALGGKKGRTGSFYANRELAKLAGAKGGRISKRGEKTMKYEEKPDVMYSIMTIVVLVFLMFGLYVIGIAWTVHEVDKNIEQIPTAGGTMVIEGATVNDLPLQNTVDGATLNTGGYDGQVL